jgi:hypothetical protein
MLFRVFNSIKFRVSREGRRLGRILRIHAFPSGFAGKVDFVLRKHCESDSEYNLYQEFYVLALQDRIRFQVVSDCGNSGASLRHDSPFAGSHFTHTGQYVFHLKDGRRIRVAIDSHDHPATQDLKILDWADVYFKTNLWPNHPYPAKVRPIVTGNSMVNMDSVGYLKSLRERPKKYDFLFVSRIYAGPGANVEHNLRLFEELAKIPCRSKIRAIFIGFQKGDPSFAGYRQRLQAAGVEATEDHFGFDELMRMSAESRICVIRAGIHSCITWRLLNMLAIGAAVILDAKPFSSWPVPLEEGKNFLSLGLRITPDCGPAPVEDYEKIIGKMEEFLIDNSNLEKIANNNARYFDIHAHPIKVADYVLTQLLDKIPRT